MNNPEITWIFIRNKYRDQRNIRLKIAFRVEEETESCMPIRAIFLSLKLTGNRKGPCGKIALISIATLCYFRLFASILQASKTNLNLTF